MFTAKRIYIAALLIYIGAFVGKAAADTVATPDFPWWLPIAVGLLHALPAFMGFKIGRSYAK